VHGFLNIYEPGYSKVLKQYLDIYSVARRYSLQYQNHACTLWTSLPVFYVHHRHSSRVNGLQPMCYSTRHCDDLAGSCFRRNFVSRLAYFQP